MLVTLHLHSRTFIFGFHTLQEILSLFFLWVCKSYNCLIKHGWFVDFCAKFLYLEYKEKCVCLSILNNFIEFSSCS